MSDYDKVYCARYEPNAKMPARQQFHEHRAVCREKWGQEPKACHTSPLDAHALTEPHKRFAEPDIPIESRSYIAKNSWYFVMEAS